MGPEILAEFNSTYAEHKPKWYLYVDRFIAAAMPGLV
jgi:hypothetical protein